MTRRIRVEEVLVFLGIDSKELLDSLRAEGLFEEDEIEPEAIDELRMAATLMQELGVNAAGVEVALHLRRRLFALEARTRSLLEVLEQRPKR